MAGRAGHLVARAALRAAVRLEGRRGRGRREGGRGRCLEGERGHSASPRSVLHRQNPDGWRSMMKPKVTAPPSSAAAGAGAGAGAGVEAGAGACAGVEKRLGAPEPEIHRVDP